MRRGSPSHRLKPMCRPNVRKQEELNDKGIQNLRKIAPKMTLPATVNLTTPMLHLRRRMILKKTTAVLQVPVRLRVVQTYTQISFKFQQTTKSRLTTRPFTMQHPMKEWPCLFAVYVQGNWTFEMTDWKRSRCIHFPMQDNLRPSLCTLLMISSMENYLSHPVSTLAIMSKILLLMFVISVYANFDRKILTHLHL